MATQLAEAQEPQGVQTIEDTGDAQSQARDFETEAREHGWTPQDDFRGDPNKWVDAETFMRRADEVMPLLKKQLAHYKIEMDKMKKTVSRLTKAEQRAYDTARADIQAEMESAVESGDLTAFRAANEKMDGLREEISAESPQAHGEDPNEEFDNFREANSWYDKADLKGASDLEKDARAYADRMADRFARQGLQKELSPSQFFAKIAEAVNAEFPQLKNKPPRPKPASDVAGVTRAPGGPRAKTAANLPPEARRQAIRFFNQGVIRAKTEAEALDKFAKDYDWS